MKLEGSDTITRPLARRINVTFKAAHWLLRHYLGAISLVEVSDLKSAQTGT